LDTTTIERLNSINREFYRVTVQNFDESRGRFWPGWKRTLTLPVVAEMVRGRESEGKQLRVLDLGCGNGRFGRFVGKNIATPVMYHGVDNNATLLERAADDLRAYPNVTARLEMRDIVEDPPDSGEYDLVVLFGVVHHLPGAEYRHELVRRLAERVDKGGVFVLTAWCFYEYARFREKLVAWPDDLEREEGDYLMDWRRGHDANSILRYCHYVDEEEQAELATATGLGEIASFRSDGHTDDINRYSVLHRA
jgi:tRNA (uracil-5-)-methyltransferase TRM9